MEQRLSLITLGVRDLAAATAFYEGLGWTRSLSSAEGVAFFQLGAVALSLFPLPSLAEDMGLEQRDLPRFRGWALAHNVRIRSEVDQLVERLCALGGELLKGPEDKPWGGYGAYVADPDGHAWEIAWNPGFPIDAGGGIRLPG